MKKTTIANIAAKIGRNAAVKAAGAASRFGYHQPKEPKILKDIRK